MDRIGQAPRIPTMQTLPTENWFRIATQRFNVYQGANDPVLSEVPENQWVFFYNTTVGEFRIFTNIGGVLFSTSAGDVNNLVFVDSLSKLPTPVSGVITLADNVTYWVTVNLDLNGNRLVGGQNTTIIGGSSENCSISSTGLSGSTALITSAYSLPMRNITITHDTALDLDATGTPTAALDWFGVNFTDCATVGTIANYNNVIWSDCALIDSANLEFDGTHGTVGLNQCILTGLAGQPTIKIPSTATINRRFRITYSAIPVPATGTGLDVSTSASIPVEGYILDTVNFSGAGTYTTGVSYDDNKSLWVNCRGVVNSASVANYYMVGNATATTISGTGTPVKVAGTTTNAAITQKFTHTSNRETYDGALDRTFKVTASATLTSGNNNQVSVYVAVNGTVVAESEAQSTTSGTGRSENIFCQTVVELSQNDYVEIFVENNTAANNITVENLNVIIEALN